MAQSQNMPHSTPQPTPLLLHQAINITHQISQIEAGPRRDRLRQQLMQLQQQLAHCTRPITAQCVPLATIPADVRQSFVQAIALLPLYQQLNAENALTGTWQSPTLQCYPSDPIPSHWQSPQFWPQIAQQFQLSPAQIHQINTQVTAAQQSLNTHTRVMQALRDRFNQLKTPTDNQALLAALVGDAVADLAVPAAIATVASQTQVILLLDYVGDRLRDDRTWHAMTPSQQTHFQQFLQGMTEFEFSQFANFPTFGKFSGKWLSGQLCRSLSETTGVSVTHVTRILQQAIGLVPMAKAEAFLVHDIYGHGWQHRLTQFGGDYAILSLAHHPLKPGLAAYTPHGPVSLRDVIRYHDGQVHILTDRACDFFHGEVQQRLTCLLTHLIGEMLADFHEFKWLWQNPDNHDQLPSSSTFKALPAKLDLGILDVEFLFERLLAPLLEMSISPQHDSLLEQSLLVEWGKFDRDTRSQLKRSLLQLHHIFWEEYLAHYQPRPAAATDEFSRIMHHLLYLQNTSNSLYRSDWAVSHYPFQDLMCLFIGVFCSIDPYERFWRLDQVLAQSFIPCWQMLLSLE